jgi:hypothetical protein
MTEDSQGRLEEMKQTTTLRIPAINVMVLKNASSMVN